MTARLPTNLLEPVRGQLWPATTELVGIEFELLATQTAFLPGSYAKGLHAWFLQQVQQHNPQLSARMHDSTSDKGFTLSRLLGATPGVANSIRLYQGERYRWVITALDPDVCAFLAAWLRTSPMQVGLRGAALVITHCHVLLPPQTYAELVEAGSMSQFSLSFLSPTSFRHRGHHLPLPMPTNLFQSYARRWLGHIETDVDVEAFLDWVDQMVTLTRYELHTEKVPAGKQGMVTGFVGAVQLSVRDDAEAGNWPLWLAALARYAPYCGTGHKTAFGLGQTRWGWQVSAAPTEATEEAEPQREAALQAYFLETKARQGGQRAQKTASLWAELIVRRDRGESLQAIATDLALPYETAKTYVKLARRALRDRDQVG